MINSPTKMKKKELLVVLESMGYSKEDLKKFKRPQLLYLYNSDVAGQNAEKGLDSISPTKEKTAVVKVDKDDKKEPHRSDPEWTQYVLGHFLDDELDGKNPRVDGLRRVAEQLVGEILEEGCDLIAPPCGENGMRACVKAWVVFWTGAHEQKFEALADACPANITGEEFATYLTAMADTRAKGRCFRNALGLKRVVAAEEVSGKIGVGTDESSDTAIRTGQITAIRMVSERLNVSLPKLLKFMELGDLKALTREQAISVFDKLNKIQTENNIPEGLKK